MEYKAVIFDFDGTLADTESFYAKNFRDTMKEQGLETDEEDEILVLGYGPYAKVAFMEEKYHVKLDADGFAYSFRKKNKELFPEDGASLLFDDVKDALVLCKEKGLKTYVCTNTDTDRVTRVLEQMGILRYFDAVIGKDISLARKPSELPYLFILKEYSYEKNEVIAIEDSNTGVISAVKAGIYTVGLQRREGLILKDADVHITSLDQLRDLI